MNAQESFDDDLITIKPRDFKCPCGKTYLSYAALFTHIKQKHDGQAPGKIIKPPTLHEKRGRPPVKPRTEKKEPQPTQDTDIPANSSDPLFPPETQQERLQRQRQAQQFVIDLGVLLERMPFEQLNKTYLNEIEVFSQMNVYLNTRTSAHNISNGNICLADGFIEFANSVCARITWKNFQAFYLLFMLFLQYIIDQENSKKILSQSNMDLFCEYVNDFIEEHMGQMSEYYSFESHWIVQKENAIRVFFKFFGWCTAKRYVTYKINLAQQDNPEEKEQDEQQYEKQ